MKSKIFLALIGLAGVISSCSDSNSPSDNGRTCFSGYKAPNIQALRTDLSSAKQRWTNAKLENYSYVRTISAYTFDPPTTLITITAGKVSSAVVKDYPAQLPNNYVPKGYTMDELFTNAEKTISSLGTCQIAKATYDAQDGHILSFSYEDDGVYGVRDTDYHYTITEFQTK